MGNSCKYRWSFVCLPTAHLLLCGLVPNWPQTITKPQDPGVGDVLTEVLKSTAFQAELWLCCMFLEQCGWLQNSLSLILPNLVLLFRAVIREQEMTIRTFCYCFHSSNLLRSNLHSDTCTDLKRTIWGLIYVYTCVTSIKIKTKNISSTLENYFMPPLNQQLPI